jgi:hypothetical protein
MGQAAVDAEGGIHRADGLAGFGWIDAQGFAIEYFFRCCF